MLLAVDHQAPGTASTTTLRQDIWTVLRFRASAPRRSGLQLASYVLELCVLVLILLNVVFAISESSVAVDPSEPAHQSAWYSVFLFTSTVIFSIEYALRLWSCVEDERYYGAVMGRLAWMMQPLSVLDLIALVPFYLEICFQLLLIPSYNAALVLRSLRLLRVVAFLRLERSYSALQNLRAVFDRKHEELLVVTYLTLVVVLTASTTMFFLESTTQPSAFSSIGACVWWSVETITSLGYGDIVPKTAAGRIFGGALAVWGVVLFTIPGAVLGSGFVEVMLEKQRSDDERELNEAVQRQQEEDQEERTHAARPTMQFSATHDARDKSLRIELPDIEALPASAGAHRSLSPSVVTVLTLHQVMLKLEALGDAQREIQEQLGAQQTQLTRMAVALEALSD